MRAILSCIIFPDLREKLVPHPHRVLIPSLFSIHFFPVQVIIALESSISSPSRIHIVSGGIPIFVSTHSTLHSVTDILVPAHHFSTVKQERVVVPCFFQRASVCGSNFMRKRISSYRFFYISTYHLFIFLRSSFLKQLFVLVVLG